MFLQVDSNWKIHFRTQGRGIMGRSGQGIKFCLMRTGWLPGISEEVSGMSVVWNEMSNEPVSAAARRICRISWSCPLSDVHVYVFCSHSRVKQHSLWVNYSAFGVHKVTGVRKVIESENFWCATADLQKGPFISSLTSVLSVSIVEGILSITCPWVVEI